MSASDYGLKTGYSYGLKTESGNGASLFSFGGRSMERSRRTFHILRRIVPHLHQALVRVVAPLDRFQEATYAKLSPREKEVLLWIKEGKTTSEISSNAFHKREDGEVSRAEHAPESSRLNQGPGSGGQPGEGPHRYRLSRPCGRREAVHAADSRQTEHHRPSRRALMPDDMTVPDVTDSFVLSQSTVNGKKPK